MDFSSQFVALRDRLAQGLDKAFVSTKSTEVAGRVAALLSRYDVTTEKKLLGMMPVGLSSHAHEYRLLFAEPVLTETALADWWGYAKQVEQTLVQPDDTHGFSIVSFILVTQSVDRAIQKKIRGLTAERQFAGGKQGWSSVHFAVVDLAAHKVYTNRMGASLKNILQPFV